MPTVNHAAHIHADVAVNHGEDCLDEKYVFHPFDVPHDTLPTVVHVFEHVELLVPLLVPSSHDSHPFCAQSPHHKSCALQLTAVAVSFLQLHVYFHVVLLYTKDHGTT